MAFFRDRIVAFITPCLLIIASNIELSDAIRRAFPPLHGDKESLPEFVTEEAGLVNKVELSEAIRSAFPPHHGYKESLPEFVAEEAELVNSVELSEGIRSAFPPHHGHKESLPEFVAEEAELVNKVELSDAIRSAFPPHHGHKESLPEFVAEEAELVKKVELSEEIHRAFPPHHGHKESLAEFVAEEAELVNKVELSGAIRRAFPPLHGLNESLPEFVAEEAELAWSAMSGKLDVEPIYNIRKLRKDLMSHYDKFARPVKNASAAVPVGIQMLSMEVAEVNEIEERMVVDTVMIMNWKDEHLQWNPREHGGIVELVLPENDIWHPDIIVHNSAPITENAPWNDTRKIVRFDGAVFWFPPATISVRCPMSLIKLTEERVCNITMASYSYFSEEVKLKLFWEGDRLEMQSDYNPIWKRTKFSASLETFIYGLFSYSEAVFTVGVKRKYHFVGEVVRGPRTVAILLTLSMFWLPSSSDKKLNLGCLVLLVLAGIIMYLSSNLASPSLLAVTVAPLRVTMLVVVSALLIEVIIINLSRLSDIVKPPPVVVRVLSGMVGRVIGVCPRLEYREQSGMGRLPDTEGEESSQAVITIEEEWSLVAMTLDRVFFIIYSVIFIAIS